MHRDAFVTARSLFGGETLAASHLWVCSSAFIVNNIDIGRFSMYTIFYSTFGFILSYNIRIVLSDGVL